MAKRSQQKEEELEQAEIGEQTHLGEGSKIADLCGQVPADRPEENPEKHLTSVVAEMT